MNDDVGYFMMVYIVDDCTVHADSYDFRMVLSMVADDGIYGGGGGDAIQKHDYATMTIWETPSG